MSVALVYPHVADEYITNIGEQVSFRCHNIFLIHRVLFLLIRVALPNKPSKKYTWEHLRYLQVWIVGEYYSSETLIKCVSARLTELENSFVPFGALTSVMTLQAPIPFILLDNAGESCGKLRRSTFKGCGLKY